MYLRKLVTQETTSLAFLNILKCYDRFKKLIKKKKIQDLVTFATDPKH